MKKLVLAIAVIISTVAFSSCQKENVAPTHKATTLADKSNLSQADDIAPVTPPAGDKSNLSQADLTGAN